MLASRLSKRKRRQRLDKEIRAAFKKSTRPIAKKSKKDIGRVVFW